MYMSVWVVLTVFANICLWNGCLFNCWNCQNRCLNVCSCLSLYAFSTTLSVPHKATNIVGASDNNTTYYNNSLQLACVTSIYYSMCNWQARTQIEALRWYLSSAHYVSNKRQSIYGMSLFSPTFHISPHFTPLIIILLSTGWMTYLVNRMIIFSTFSICVIISLTCPKCVFAAINQNHMQCTMHLNFVLFNRTSGLQSHRHWSR